MGIEVDERLPDGLGQQQNIGFLTLITTSDTTISPGLIDDATSRRVVLFQAFVWEIKGATPAQSTF